MPVKSILALALASAALVGCADDGSSTALSSDASLSGEPIAKIAAESDDLTTLFAAIKAAGLGETLEGEGPFTVFAPTNEAFDKLPDGLLDDLLNDPDALRDILLYHVVADELLALDVLSVESLPTVLGPPITVQADGPTLNETVGLVATDVVAKNGVVHLIDMVLIPPTDQPTAEEEPESPPPAAADETPDEQPMMPPQPAEPAPEPEGEPELKSIVEIAAGDDRFETLVAALQLTGLDEALSGDGPFTVFAPTDDAFDALPEGVLDGLLNDLPALEDILLYHVVSGDFPAAAVVATDALTTLLGPEITVQGDALTLNGNVNLVITNVFASNGVIHVIDAVLVPPAPEESESNTIVDIVEGDDRFETLLAALQLTGLDETLSGEGPFTVFAPTDDAFDALPMDVLDALLANPDALAEVLLYHVVLDELLAEEVVSRHSLTSALGPRITVQGNQLTLNGDVNLIVTDVIADNGVIHVIDKVLVPPSH